MTPFSTRYSDGVLLDLVGLLYDAAGDVGKWQTFVDAAKLAFQSTAAHLLAYNPNTHQVHLNFSIYSGVSPKQEKAYFDFMADRAETPIPVLDARALLAAQNCGKAITCTMLPDRAAFERSDLYQMILHPFDIDYTLGIYVPHEPPCYSAMALMRGLGRGAYDAEDVAALNKLAPHFDRAIRLQQQLMEIDLQKRTALDALNLLPIGMVIVDSNAHVIFANQTAQRLSQEEGGISMHGGRVWASNPKQTADIHEKIRMAVISAAAGKLVPGWSMALKRPLPHRPLALTISPLWGNHLKTSLGFLQRPYGILFLHDPDSAQETHAELLQRLYALTTSEAVVLKHLCKGLKPKEIANILQVSITTVRTHLSALFAKTATATQSELIRLALCSQPQTRL